jgi:hypothetical protein
MTTSAEAYTVIKSRLEGNQPVDLTGGYRWQNGPNEPLPETPAPFAYVEFLIDLSGIVGFGGGQGQNRYRHPARIEGFVFIPKGHGLTPALAIAEQLANLFLSYRDDDISCWSATAMPGGDGAMLKPEGLDSEVGNYFWASFSVDLHFDKIG